MILSKALVDIDTGILLDYFLRALLSDPRIQHVTS